MVEVLESLALENHARPSILFRVSLDYQDASEVVISIGGRLVTHDGFVVAYLREEYSEKPDQQPRKLAARGSVYDQSFFKPTKHLANLIGQFDERTLRRVDDSRLKDPKRDVKLKLEIGIKVLESVATIDQLTEVEPKNLVPGKTLNIPRAMGGEVPANLIVRGWGDPNFQSPKTNGWSLSGNSNPTFLQFKIRKEEVVYRIPAQDWISDFAPKLGMGHHIVVEMPTKEGSLFQDTSTYLTKAEEAFRRWDTKGVFSNCREIGTLLDKAVKDKYGKDSFAYAEKWGRAYERFSHWASFDLHLEDFKKSYKEGEVRTDRSDSETLLLTTKILIKYAQEVGT